MSDKSQFTLAELLIVAASTALARIAPPSFLAGHTFFVRKGDTLHLDRLREQLTVAGYAHVTQVVAAGEYSVRGGLVDLFPMGTALPYRIELFDDTVETIRVFDVDSQRTLYPVPEIRLLPAREFPMDEAGRNRFRARFRAQHFEITTQNRARSAAGGSGIPCRYGPSHRLRRPKDPAAVV